MNVKKNTISTDLKKLDGISDADINYSDIPELDESFFSQEPVVLPKKKDSITLRIDHEVLEFFKNQGKGYQTFMNAVLKTYVDSQKTKKRHF